MRRFQRLTAAILTAALAMSLFVLPTSAAPGSFSDVADQKTAVNADILRLMGVVTGTGGNQFNPHGTLTRAQFCTMVMTFLQKGDEAPRYATRTIFTDVTSTHWARSFVNMAASYTVTEGEGENTQRVPLVSGVGDGRFLPDAEITLAEAVTILLRALSYTSKEAGAVWPQGYLDLANSIGLTDGVGLSASSSISRAQAAQLFVNALSCKTKDNKPYYTTLGTVPSDKAIILAVGVETDDGSSTGAVRTTNNKGSEAYLPAQGEGSPTALQGKRGWLVLNDKEELVTFVPDDSTATTITLNGDAQPGYVKGGAQQYTISASTPVYTTGGGGGSQYLEAYDKLTSGTQITMYAEKGKIVAIYSTSGTTTIDSDAVVVMGHANAATFHGLTGGATSFNIVKDRQPITLSQIKPYDVATYDQLTNTLVVSDLRMTAVYTDPAPTPKTPLTIQVAGNKFDVLQSAWDTIGDIKPGDNVSLLLTADGKVAGIVKSDPKVRSTAIGMVTEGSAEIFLPNGSTLKLSGKVSNAASVGGQPVVISAGRDAFSVSRLSENRAPGAFDVPGLKLGKLTVSSSVRIYEQSQSGSVVSVDRGSLDMASIPAERISSYHVNSANIVDYIVLNNVTGSAYIYGMMVGGYKVTQEAKPGTPAVTNPDGTITDATPDIPEQTRYIWHLRNGQNDIEFSLTTTYTGQSGDMLGVAVGKDREGKNTIKTTVQLKEVKNVKLSDFFESQGATYVNTYGRTYRVADNVECYYNRTGNKVSKDNWLSGGDGGSRLTSIKAYSDSFTIYVDPVGEQVRIIAAN